MAAVRNVDQLDKRVANILSPCPANERVCEVYDVPEAYAPGTKHGREGESISEDGIIYQRCGGGRRIIKKRIGGT